MKELSESQTSARVGIDLLQPPEADTPCRLLTRANLVERLAGCLTAAADDGSQVALLLIDLDRFRTINDSLGHEAGDVLLQTIGKRLSMLARRTDLVAYLGADEFAVVLTDLRASSDADRAARRILDEISLPLTLCGREVSVTGSSGGCLFPLEASNASEMLRNADLAMYEAKHGGRNNWRLGTRAMSRRANAALDVETGLRRALQRQEFELYYQPQLDLCSGEIRSVEALIRWHRPGVGLILPGDFIPHAEACGLIGEIGTWVLHAAARQINEWERTGGPLVSVAVNVSATQFHGGALLDCVRAVLQQTGLAASRLELEITEGVVVHKTGAAIGLLQQLRELGVAISLDDFGTGYSCLSYLRRLPLDTLKIDRSFIEDLTTETAALAVVRGIVELARGLGLRVIAEGVTTYQQLCELRRLRCDTAQGFFIGPPLPAAQLQEFLAQWLLLSRAAADSQPMPLRSVGGQRPRAPVGTHA